MAFRTITWNTGRLYTSEGQVMTARYDCDTRCVIFADHSRGIAGELREALPDYWSDPTDSDIRAFVDTEYLHNRYDYNRDAWALQRQDGKV